MFRSIRRAWPSSSSTMMMVTGLVISGVPDACVPLDRQRDGEGAAVIEFRGHRHGAAEPPHQSADMCKSYALAGLVLDSGAAEQLENALVILGVDAAAIVGHVEHRISELCAAPDFDLAR